MLTLPVDSIYCITLAARGFGRRKLIEKHLAEVGGMQDRNKKPLHYVYGINGSDADHRVDNSVKMANRRGMMSAGEIGCFASHRIVWKLFLETKAETCLVLEDDFRFGQKAEQFFSLWNRFPKDWDYVNFGYITNTKSIHNDLTRVHVEPFINLFTGCGMWLTHAYAINRHAAEVFLANTEVQYGGIDWQLTGIQNKVKSYGFSGNAVISQAKIPSQIIHTQ